MPTLLPWKQSKTGKEYFLPTEVVAFWEGGGEGGPKKYKDHIVITSPSKKVCMLNNNYFFIPFNVILPRCVDSVMINLKLFIKHERQYLTTFPNVIIKNQVQLIKYLKPIEAAATNRIRVSFSCFENEDD